MNKEEIYREILKIRFMIAGAFICCVLSLFLSIIGGTVALVLAILARMRLNAFERKHAQGNSDNALFAQRHVKAVKNLSLAAIVFSAAVFIGWMGVFVYTMLVIEGVVQNAEIAQMWNDYVTQFSQSMNIDMSSEMLPSGSGSGSSSGSGSIQWN